MSTTLKTVKRCVTAGLLAASVLLVGCTHWRFELGEPLAQLDTGSRATPMRLAEVLDRLGPPQYLTATESGWVMAWEHLLITEDSVGLSLGLLGADFLNADWGSMNTSGEYLLLGFDRDYQVVSAERSAWGALSGSGMAVQPLASVLSVVESDDLRDPLPQHRWGASLLQQFSAGLNRDSNLDEGRSGLQRRGTSGVVGQHSLDTSR